MKDLSQTFDDLKPGQVVGWIPGQDGPSGAELTQLGAADITGPCWNDLRVPLSSANLPTVSDPTYAEFRTGVYAMRFAGNLDNVLAFETQLPHSYVEGTDLKPHIHWATATAPVVGQTVTWKLTYTIANVGDVWPTASTLSATHTFTAADEAFQQEILGLGTITGTDLRISAVLIGTLTRMSSTDTYADPVFGISFDLHHQQDSIGSDAEFTKPDFVTS